MTRILLSAQVGITALAGTISRNVSEATPPRAPLMGYGPATTHTGFCGGGAAGVGGDCAGYALIGEFNGKTAESSAVLIMLVVPGSQRVTYTRLLSTEDVIDVRKRAAAQTVW